MGWQGEPGATAAAAPPGRARTVDPVETFPERHRAVPGRPDAGRPSGDSEQAIPVDAPLPSVPLPRAPGRLRELVRSSVDLPGRPIELVRPRAAMEALYEQNFDAYEEFPPYWAELWPSSVALARAVTVARPVGARVLELGCGLGLPSIAAAAAGAHVLATDRSPDALGFVAYNADRNGVSVEVEVCSWAQPDPVVSRAPWDLVLAADVLYLHRGLADLDALLPRLVDGTGEVWLADPGRPPAAAFLESAGRWAGVSEDRSDDPGVTVHRLRARDR